MNSRTVLSSLSVFLLVMALFLPMSSFLAGCGSNNPTGPENITVATNASGSAVTTTTVGGISISGNYIYGKVVNTSGVGIASAVVTLLDARGVPIVGKSPFYTVVSGEYVFDQLATGTIYFLKVTHPDYLEGAQFVQVSADGVNNAPSITLSTPPGQKADLVSIDIMGVIQSRDQDWSTALVISDSGLTAISTATGSFFLRYMEGGIRTIRISKPGVGTNSFAFEVATTSSTIDNSGRKIGDWVKFEGTTIAAAAYVDLGQGKRVANLGVLTTPYEFHPSAAFTGNAFYADSNDGVRIVRTPVPFYTFAVWAWDEKNKIFSKFRTVTTDSNGRWQVDNIPALGDNEYLWYLTEKDGDVSTTVGNAGAVYTLSKQLTSGYRAVGGQTTVIDFAVPGGSTTTETAIPPILAGPANNLQVPLGNVAFSWSAMVSAVTYRLNFVSVSDSSITKAIDIPIQQIGYTTPPASGTALTSTVDLQTSGLAAGKYLWTLTGITAAGMARTSTETRLLELTAPNVDIVSVPPVLVDPANNTSYTLGDVPFSWLSMEKAITYRLSFVSSTDSTVTKNIDVSIQSLGYTTAPASGTVLTGSVNLKTAGLAAGKYLWTIIGTNDTGSAKTATETRLLELTTPVIDVVKAPTDLGLAINTGANSTVFPQFFSLTDNANFSWTAQGTATQYLLRFTSAYADTQITATSVVNIPSSSSPTSQTKKLVLSTLGLGWGPYTWAVGAVDPSTQATVWSDAVRIVLRPGVGDLYPPLGTRVTINPVSSYTVSFSWPHDPNSSHVAFSIYRPDGTLGLTSIPSNQSSQYFQSIDIGYPAGAPDAGTYTWNVRYFYSDGSTMDSETASVNFQAVSASVASPPILVGPANNASYTLGDVPFSWKSMDQAITYRLSFLSSTDSTVTHAIDIPIQQLGTTTPPIGGTDFTITINLKTAGLTADKYLWTITGTNDTGSSKTATETRLLELTTPVVDVVKAPVILGVDINSAGVLGFPQSFSLTDNANFSWTAQGTATEYLLQFTSAYPGSQISATATVTILPSTGATTQTKKLVLSTLGLGWGAYTLAVAGVDPVTQAKVWSDSVRFVLRPSAGDMTPAANSSINATATPNVTFSWPKDSNATHYTWTRWKGASFVSNWTTSNNTSTATTTPTLLPTTTPGAFTWSVKYFYDDGSSIESETSTYTVTP